MPVRGTLHVDAGCAAALLQKKNLYAPGVRRAVGAFSAMDAVEIVDSDGGTVLARGLINFSAEVRLARL